MTIAPVPESWRALLPKAGEPAALAHDLTFAPEQDQAVLRQRLIATAKGKRGEGWACLRRAAAGERMFRVVNGPGDPALPVVSGVDDFISKGIIFALAGAGAPEDGGPHWHETSPGDIALLLDPSLAHLRADCRALGQESRFTREHVAGKWVPAAQKQAAEHAQAVAFLERMTQATTVAESSAEQGLPLVLQLDAAYLVLDDREAPPVYQGPVGGQAITALARQVWIGKPRPLDVPKAANTLTMRAMTPAELVQTYGRSIVQCVTELGADHARVEDLTLIRPAITTSPLEPEFDPDVAAWLSVLAGDRLHMLEGWIAYATRERMCGVTPALVLVGAPAVGKDCLAQAVARAAGLRACADLSQALGQFGGVIATHPILFSNEGLPRGRTGQPMTEEFRRLVTLSDHVIEQKGVNERQPVRGGVRVILAANRVDRLFANRGSLDANDVAALVRRLLVIDVGSQGTDRAVRAATMIRALGAFENDPARLERVARHLRWIQVERANDPEPRPDAGALRGQLRRGGDTAGAALSALEDGAARGAEWVAVDPSGYRGAPEGIAWVKADEWGRAAGLAPGALVRGIASYVCRESARLRRHPITGLVSADGSRPRWIGLDLGALRADGIELDDPAEG